MTASSDSSLPLPLGDRIDVYRDDPIWETVAKPFMLPLHILKELYICTYQLPVDEDGDVINPKQCLNDVLANHKDEVVQLVYIER